MISFSVDTFESSCKQRPKGYRDHVLSFGKIVDGRVWLKPEDHTYLCNYYRSKEIQEPRITESAKFLTKSLKQWAKAGFPVADKQTVKARKQSCINCGFWNAEARMGLGKCTHQKCGCTKIKWWLATEKCPIGKW
jgi:hypothetical protein